MAKSKETFSKKEKEKKRVKKRKDKEEKKLERKANAVKGKSLEDMMAYIDENGNLSSTPPNPLKKKEFELEDISIGVARQVPVVEDIIRTGKVTFFNESKGYGFIKDDISKEGIFVHISSLNISLKENDSVTFEIEKNDRGLQAVAVKLKTD